MFETYAYQYDQTSKTYNFETRFGINVRLLIARDQSWFPYNPEINEVYSFDLLAFPKSQKLDFKIRNTVVEILSKLFENKNVVITYFCDDEDGKEAKRDSAFDRWYKALDNDSIHKYDRHVICEEKYVYSSILLHKENVRYDRAISAYMAGDADVTEKFYTE